jgi:type IV secretory pathway TrbF-like protein
MSVVPLRRPMPEDPTEGPAASVVAPPVLPPPQIDPTFNAAKRLYAEQFGDAIVTNTYLKLAVASLALITLLLAYTQYRVARTLSDFQPLVIRVDRVGEAEAVRYGDFKYVPQEPEVKYFLGEFCRLYYGRNRDSLSQNFRRSLSYLTPQVANAVIDAWSHGNVIKDYTASNLGDVDIDVLGVDIQSLAAAPYQATVHLHQIQYKGGERTVSSKVLYNAHFTFHFQTGQLPSSVLAVNPLGLLIDHFKEDVVLQ